MDRFSRNKSTIGLEDQKKINSSKVLVIGCGGLGGSVIEGLARVGFLEIGICEFDLIEVSNLNRQILSTEKSIGSKKIELANDRIKDINSEIKVNIYDSPYPNKQIDNDIKKYDLIVDCLDSIEARKILENHANELNIPLIYGAIGGNYGYFGVSTKENPIIKNQIITGISTEKKLGNPYYIVGMVSSLQVFLTIQVILQKEYLQKGFYCIDLLSMSIDEVFIK